MMDVLSGVLTGSGYATGVTGPYVPDRRSGCGHLVLALRVDAVIDPADFDRRIDDLIDLTKGVPLARGAEEIFYPGEIEDRAEATARRDGVALPDRTVAELRALAGSCGVRSDALDTAAMA
jgi:LDH2 family malate/lactate/ureidoglycolate dehydrogenase